MGIWDKIKKAIGITDSNAEEDNSEQTQLENNNLEQTGETGKQEKLDV